MRFNTTKQNRTKQHRKDIEVPEDFHKEVLQSLGEEEEDEVGELVNLSSPGNNPRERLASLGGRFTSQSFKRFFY